MPTPKEKIIKTLAGRLDPVNSLRVANWLLEMQKESEKEGIKKGIESLKKTFKIK